MKIIGTTSEGFIAQISRRDLAMMCGFSYESGDDFRAYLAKHNAYDQYANSSFGIKLGSEIPVSKWWDRLETIRRREDELGKLGDTLQSLAHLIKSAWPSVMVPLEHHEVKE